MKFAVVTLECLENYGFYCNDFRKSIDRTKAIVHLEYARTLIPNIENNINIKIYNLPSAELTELLNSPEWSTQEE